MAKNLTAEELRALLKSGDSLGDAFGVLRAVGHHLTFAKTPAEEEAIRQLVILLLNRRSEFNGFGQVVDSLALAAGLYPYADTASLSSAELFEYEAHRPDGLEDTVFHRVQASVYNALMDGESVVLSAPTSFGKSLIIDALLASEKFDNVAVVVPTIALIDETRRRISRQFGSRFKVVTHPSQSFDDRNVLVMTQERLLETEVLPPLDLFVIDEFYKLDPASDSDRSNLLNHAFYRLKKTGAQFYLLGPNVSQMPVELNSLARVVLTDFNTVALDVQRVQTGDDDLSALIRLCAELTDPTLVFCKSPAQARDVTLALAESLALDVPDELQGAIGWVSQHYHPGWSFVRGLAAGVGMHHGRIPRSLGQLAVRAFNAELIRFLVCTSTLIEGVNTTAKNVVIFDNKIANSRYDFFTFNNIKGRSGRMFSHFVGHVYTFHEPPVDDLRAVDVPVLTQPDETKSSLLVQLDPEDLSSESRSRIEEFVEQDELPLEDIRRSAGVDPELLVALARRLRSNTALVRRLAWSGYPSRAALSDALPILWDDLGGRRFSTSYVRSAPQLGYRLSRLSQVDVNGLISEAIAQGVGADEAVESVLEFVRNWCGFHLPRLLMTLERVQNRVAEDLRTPTGSYGFYATQVESLFRPRAQVVLEEYGLPLQLSDQLHPTIGLEGSLDEVFAKLKAIDVERLALSRFEKGLVRDVVSTL